MVDSIHPQWFRFKPAKMLRDPSYQSPRITEKSPQLRAIEARQKELNGERLPENVAKFHQSNR